MGRGHHNNDYRPHDDEQQKEKNDVRDDNGHNSRDRILSWRATIRWPKLGKLGRPRFSTGLLVLSQSSARGDEYAFRLP